MSADDRVEDEELGGASLHRANQQQARVNRDRVRSGDSTVDGVVVHKVCCVCGTILNRKLRFKDHEGRYWCPACNGADQTKVQPLPCADCGIETPRMDLKQVGGLMLCPVCVTKITSETKVVAKVRLSALGHGQGRHSTAKRTAREVAKSRNDRVIAMLWVALGAIIAALIVLMIVRML